jgi:3-methylcrotonyl-CoA carboxylase alpha subunit
LQHNKFINNQLTTDFLQKEQIVVTNPDPLLAAYMASAIYYLRSQEVDDKLLSDTFGWQILSKRQWNMNYIVYEEQYEITILPNNSQKVTLQYQNQQVTWNLKITNHTLQIDDGNQNWQVLFTELKNKYILYQNAIPTTVTIANYPENIHNNNLLSSNYGKLTAPMPATVVAIMKPRGSKIKTGDCLMVLEAMKMEHTINSPTDGLITEIFYQIGDQVSEGAQLISIEITTP